MMTGRGGPRRPPPHLSLLLVWLLGLQLAGSTAAQDAEGPPVQVTGRGAGPTWGAGEDQSETELDQPGTELDQTGTEPDLGTDGLQLTTSQRQQHCEDSTGPEPAGEAADGSARNRRSSERTLEQRPAAGGGPAGCPVTWDGVLCWPATSAGRNRSLPCFHEFRGVFYSPDGRASRACRPDGVWASSSDYTACLPLPIGNPCAAQHTATSIEATAVIYLTGYSISLVALIAATAIFRYFKELHCPRNIIHSNLFVACMMNDALWIAVLIIKLNIAGTTPTSCGMIILLQYFHVATFFWMFVEGLNLYMMVVQTFTVDRVRLYLYMFIGWGLPMVPVTAWSIVRAFTAVARTPEETAELSLQWCAPADGNLSYVRGLELPLEPSFFTECPFLEPSGWDWIHVAPSLLVLFCNVVFLARIMCVLITKLRSTNSAETQLYKKATKALLVLLPLLGVTYILVLVSPKTTSVIFYIQVLLVATQGLVVSMLYCFGNTEVQLTLRKHWRRWRGKAYLSPAEVQRTKPETVTSRLRANGDTSATDLTCMTAMESDDV